jgi:thiamine pyrophosphokinase
MLAIRIRDRDRGTWDLLGEPAGPRVLVVLAGAGFDRARLRGEAARAVAVVAADAGADLCLAAGLEPSLVAGDFDSISQDARERLGAARLFPSNDPDSNDLEKALALVSARFGPDAEVVLAAGGGVDGGRMDHTLANLGPLIREPHARISMVDGEGRTFALRSGSVTLEGLEGRQVSVLPWTLHGVEVSERGARYPLDHATLFLGGGGVSNRIEDSEATIEVHDGVALIWVET